MIWRQIGKGSPGVAYRYNKDGKLTNVLYSPSALNKNVTYTYDADGRVLTVSNGDNWAYKYDKNNNVTSAILSYCVNGIDKTLSFIYSYDGFNHLSSITYPDHTIVSYNPDPLGLARKAGDFVKSVHYYPNSKVKDFTGGNNFKTAYGLNNRQMDNALTVTTAGGSPIVKQTYSYDGSGNTSAIRNVLVPSRSQTFTYNPENWLITQTVAGHKTNLVYDAFGNLTAKTVEGSNLLYTYNNNLLQSVSGTVTTPSGAKNVSENFTYDAYGDITSNNGSSKEFTYNDSMQLVSAHGKNPLTGQSFDVHYYYDGNGNRVQITQGDQTILEVHNSKSQLLYRWNLKTNQVTDYIYLNNKKVAEVTHAAGQKATASNATYLYNDILGSPLQEVNASGQVSWNPSQSYRPFGTEVYQTNEKEEHISYTGKLHDDSTGLSYYGARYYDPVIGRFLSIDPAAIDVNRPITFNRYAYAADNPMTYIDPDGRDFSFGNMFNFGSHGWKVTFNFSAGFDNAVSFGVMGNNGQYNTLSYRTGFLVGSLLGATYGSTEYNLLKGGTRTLLEGGEYALTVSETSASSALQAERLNQQLAGEEASSIFGASGELNSSVIQGSTRIIEGEDIGNQALRSRLVGVGGNIEDWGKYETQSFRSPSGPFKVHFYHNPEIKRTYYDMDYKSIFNHQGAGW
ncbi:RHS repeat domain-containing protein [Piscirickettsia litoralis]|uniref:Teneurin-like YD-shell domain-containing protein n=1 Tax=Piscirickettsia litoralis TaxID=1891921 RepID=A0ABX3A6I4_9GAMM|nr:RHS repeat-associated core domain-containing protein [Piscirickettsia litoralis]ODN43253.1 hypothetical protein BGC07_10405 [Piscirickettsia litoralis]